MTSTDGPGGRYPKHRPPNAMPGVAAGMANDAAREDSTAAQKAAAATSLPAYLLCNKRVREAVDVPCLHINSSLRFNLHEVMNWARRWSAELEQQGIEPQ